MLYGVYRRSAVSLKTSSEGSKAVVMQETSAQARWSCKKLGRKLGGHRISPEMVSAGAVTMTSPMDARRFPDSIKLFAASVATPFVLLHLAKQQKVLSRVKICLSNSERRLSKTHS